MAAKSTNKDLELKEENKTLRKELEEMKKMILSLSTNQNNNVSLDVPDNKMVKVMSLEMNPLLLSTEGRGNGKKYLFNKFGRETTIIFSDLRSIVDNQERFAKEGRFYILDKTIVDRLGLSEDYENILNKEDMLNILNCDKKEIKEKLSKTSKAQLFTVISLVLQKISNGENVDLNKIKVISEVYEKDILELI
jgi:hypothetical protein